MTSAGIVLEATAAARLAAMQTVASRANAHLLGLGVVAEGRVAQIVVPRNARKGGFDHADLWQAVKALRDEGIGDRQLAVVRAAPTATTRITRLDLAVAQMLGPAGCPRLFVFRGALRPTLALTAMAAGQLLAFAAPLPVVDDGRGEPTAADRLAWRHEALRALRWENSDFPNGERHRRQPIDLGDPVGVGAVG